MEKLICPKCNVEMTFRNEGNIEIVQCPRCEGIWVDNVSEKQVLEMEPTVFTVDELRRLRAMYKPWGRTEKVKYFKCPRCDNLMWRKNYLGHSGIVVDKCGKHGTFFDKEELEKAREFIRVGGVEYQKLRIAEVGISELHTKINTVSDKVERISYKLPWYSRMLLYFGF